MPWQHTRRDSNRKHGGMHGQTAASDRKGARASSRNQVAKQGWAERCEAKTLVFERSMKHREQHTSFLSSSSTSFVECTPDDILWPTGITKIVKKSQLPSTKPAHQDELLPNAQDGHTRNCARTPWEHTTGEGEPSRWVSYAKTNPANAAPCQAMYRKQRIPQHQKARGKPRTQPLLDSNGSTAPKPTKCHPRNALLQLRSPMQLTFG